MSADRKYDDLIHPLSNVSPVLFPLTAGGYEGGDVPEDAPAILHHGGRLAPEELDQEAQGPLQAAHVRLVLLAVGGEIPEGREYHLDQSVEILKYF